MYFDGGNNFKISIRKSIQNEIISFLNRLFSPKIRKPRKNLVQVGCGQYRFENFENLDFYSSSFSFWKKKKFVGHDFRFPLPYKDNVFEGAFSEHVLEHLYFDEAKKLLNEICRILKTGSIFRCTVPGLNLFVENYINQINNEYFLSFDYGCDAFRDITQNIF